MVAATAALVVLAFGSVGASVGLSQSEQLRDRPDSVKGQETIAKTFGPGTAEPAAIITETGTEQTVTRIVAATPGVTNASVGAAGGGLGVRHHQDTA